MRQEEGAGWNVCWVERWIEMGLSEVVELRRLTRVRNRSGLASLVRLRTAKEVGSHHITRATEQAPALRRYSPITLFTSLNSRARRHRLGLRPARLASQCFCTTPASFACAVMRLL